MIRTKAVDRDEYEVRLVGVGRGVGDDGISPAGEDGLAHLAIDFPIAREDELDFHRRGVSSWFRGFRAPVETDRFELVARGFPHSVASASLDLAIRRC